MLDILIHYHYSYNYSNNESPKLIEKVVSTMEQKINRNYNLKWLMHNELPATWANKDLGCTVHELKYESPSGDYHNEIKTDANGVKWLVYEMEIPTSVQAHVKNFLSSYGLKWNRIIFLETFANEVSKAYDMLGQRVGHDTFHKDKPLPYQIQTSFMKAKYEAITQHPFYNLYKSDFDEIAAEQYEDYYKTVMEGIKNVQA
jgi:hypothetical protein